MRKDAPAHRPVTELPSQPTQLAWMGNAEAARQQALLRMATPTTKAALAQAPRQEA